MPIQAPNIDQIFEIADDFGLDLSIEDAQSFENYLIELGGELRARGNNQRGKPWQVGIEQPDAKIVGRIRSSVKLRDRAIATSGSYRNYTRDSREPNVTYTHILDPRSGRPISHKLVSVSVLQQTTMRADALSTAFMVLGPRRGYELAVQENVAAIFVSKSDDGFVERMTPAFEAELVHGLQTAAR